MNSLRIRVLVALALVAVFLGGAAFWCYVAYRTKSVQREAEHYGSALADAMVAAVLPRMATADKEGLQDLLQTLVRSHLYESAAVIGRSGTVLASEPAVAGPADPDRNPRCAGCHSQRPPLPVARLDARPGGERLVQVFRALPADSSCVRCHTSADSPLGYLYIDVGVTTPFQRLRTDAVRLIAGAGAAILLLLLCAYGVLSRMVVRPLWQLREEAERLERGEAGVAFTVNREDELGAVAAALNRAARRQQGVLREISALVSHLGECGVNVQMALSRLREGVSAGRNAAEAILRSVDGLNTALEETRTHLDAIAGSTSDNSTSLIQMSASIDEVAGTADDLAQQVSAVASSVIQMVQSTAEVAENVEGLARETEATVSSMSQIDASTRRIEKTARQAADLGEEVARAAEEGSGAVQETLRGIHDSYAVIQETADVMAHLAEASRNIDRVVKIINEINDKTKLLALNAAIIAAQAGEHGRSFAVVAHEIQNLSERTTASTGEISRIVRRIQEQAELATGAVARGQEATARSVELAERAGASLQHILEKARAASRMNQSILKATEEQARGSRSVTDSMRQVNAMVSHIRQAVQEHRTSGDLVSQSTDVMRNLTEQVKLATAEQAEVSRYISEAVAAIDKNLQDILNALARERQETGRILEHLRNLKERTKDQDGSIHEVERVLHELQAQIRGLEKRASALVGGGTEKDLS